MKKLFYTQQRVQRTAKAPLPCRAAWRTAVPGHGNTVRLCRGSFLCRALSALFAVRFRNSFAVCFSLPCVQRRLCRARVLCRTLLWPRMAKPSLPCNCVRQSFDALQLAFFR
jgi:hypothetical protein